MWNIGMCVCVCGGGVCVLVCVLYNGVYVSISPSVLHLGLTLLTYGPQGWFLDLYI